MTLVGTTEADIEKGRISNESPIGAALLDKKLNEVVQVKTLPGPLLRPVFPGMCCLPAAGGGHA